MICEMDYDQITIKELTERAQINRKTFYLHYNSLDDLLAELQDEIAENFIKRKVSYGSMKDIRDLIRLFFRTRGQHARCCMSVSCAAAAISRYGKKLTGGLWIIVVKPTGVSLALMNMRRAWCLPFMGQIPLYSTGSG